MHPTIDEQLAGARRLLDQATQDPAIPAGPLELFANVRRLLEQVARSWSSLPAFHRSDNDEITALLASLHGVLSTTTRQRLENLVGEPSDGCDAEAAAKRNVNLRALLTQVIQDLPKMDDAGSARAEIARYLRRRVESDPS